MEHEYAELKLYHVIIIINIIIIAIIIIITIVVFVYYSVLRAIFQQWVIQKYNINKLQYQ